MQHEVSTHVTLLARLADGNDRVAWQDFHTRYAELIRGFARRRGLQEADAEDVVQDVLLSLSKAMAGFEYDPARGKFRSYLKTVTQHAIFRRFSQNPAAAALSQVGSVADAGSGGSDAETAWEAEWREYHMREAWKTVSSEFNDTDLRAFQRYAVAGESVGDVASSLGLSVDAVYQAKSRILRRLGAVIATQVEAEG
ncbi:MAG: sigma-70 family RNA polymerase sigma factor [Phycisphaerae bacterium]|nr:sigma-70 family RNA polymerase sigma factor [Phycisphaerae bacterium]